MNKKKVRKNERVKRLGEILPLFWNSYQHMYDARERKAKGMVDFLLVISTFLPLLSIALYTTDLFKNILILLPIIPQFISIIILLKYFAVNTPAVHWFMLDNNLLDGLENGNFEIKTIAILKKLEGFTYTSMLEESKLIKKARTLLLSSLFILCLSALFVLFGGGLYLYLSSLILIIAWIYIIFVFYKKRPDFSGEDKLHEDNTKLLTNWINQNETTNAK